MKYLLIILAFTVSATTIRAQSTDEKAVRDILSKQTECWNRGDLENFMVGYWQNDSLMFVGKSGVTYGYTNTLNNYKKNYSDTAQMGKLFFDIIKVQRLAPEYYWVLGKWFLKRSVGNIGGHYTLLFRKINGKWLIIADHSS